MSDTATLTVATFNIRNSRALDGRNSWLLRRPATAAVLRGLDADVVGLQEAFRRPLRYLVGHAPGMATHGEGRSGAHRGEHAAVLVRTARLEVLAERTLWFADDPYAVGARLPNASFPRITTHVQLRDVTTGHEFDVWNVHLDERHHVNRLRSTTMLAEWLRPHVPAVVCGDFNATPDDTEVFAPLAAAGLRPVLPADAPGTAHDYRRERTDIRRLDHIWLSDAWTLQHADVVTTMPHGRYPSDHWPVRAVIALAPMATTWHTSSGQLPPAP